MTKDEDTFKPIFAVTDDPLAFAHDRAIEAKEDFLGQLPGDLYRLMRQDIESVWDLLESPIEQVAIFQLAGENYSYYRDRPVHAKVVRERGTYSHKQYPVQLIPQVKFGPYRVDFLFDLGSRGLIAIECDGADYHLDKERDRQRDNHLREHFGVAVLRAAGSDLWRNNRTAALYASVIQARLL